MTPSNQQISIDPAARKAVLRMLTYGLYTLGVARGEDRNLATVNWVTQVSFEPPLLAVSVENDSHSIEIMRETDIFALSVLSQEQREEAGLLGKRWKLRPDKIDGVRHHPGHNGCPVLDGALGVIECRVSNSLPAGDSTLFLAEVTTVEVLGEGAPLTMAEAGFRHAG
jgi:flavin reductase (DIM6/NTAB) family NADH-FMN oxidoreductase RutF